MKLSLREFFHKYGDREVSFDSFDSIGRFHFSGKGEYGAKDSFGPECESVYLTVNSPRFSFRTNEVLTVAGVAPDLAVVRRWDGKAKKWVEVDSLERE